MKYTKEIEIQLPRGQVIALFDDQDNLGKWLDGFQSFTHKSGEAGQPGAVSDIVMQMGKRRITMEETIEVRDLPNEFTAVYTTDGMWNRSSQFFSEPRDGVTIWRQENEFLCSGLMMKLMMAIMPGMFKRQTMKQMVAFKAFAENT